MYPFPCNPSKDSRVYRKLLNGEPAAFVADIARGAVSADITSFSFQALATVPVKLEFYTSPVMAEPLENPLWQPCEEIQPFTLNAGENHFSQGAWNTTKRYVGIRVTPIDGKPVRIAMSLCFGSCVEPTIERLVYRRDKPATRNETALIFTPEELEEYIKDGFLNGTHSFINTDIPNYPAQNYIYDIETKQALEFAGGSWVSTGFLIDDVFWKNTNIRNPYTGQIYKTKA